MNQALALLAELKRLLDERDKYIFQLETEKEKLAGEVATLKTALNEQKARWMEAVAQARQTPGA